jgi:hypothetical protein
LDLKKANAICLLWRWVWLRNHESHHVLPLQNLQWWKHLQATKQHTG